MAIKGSLSVFGISIENAYLRLGGISGGKQSGIWQADVQVFSDGGAAAQAYEAAAAAYAAAPLDAPPPLAGAMDAVRVQAGLPLVTAAFAPNVQPYAALYAVLQTIYPNFTTA